MHKTQEQIQRKDIISNNSNTKNAYQICQQTFQQQYIQMEEQKQLSNKKHDDEGQQQNIEKKIIRFQFKLDKQTNNNEDQILEIRREQLIKIKKIESYNNSLKKISEYCQQVVIDHYMKDNQKRQLMRKLLKNGIIYILRYKKININNNKITFNKYLVKYIDDIKRIKQKINNFKNKCNQYTKNISEKIKNQKILKPIEIFYFSQKFQIKSISEQIYSNFTNQHIPKIPSFQKIIQLLKNNLIHTHYFNYVDCPGCVSFFQQYSPFGFQPYGKLPESNIIHYPNLSINDKQTKQMEKEKYKQLSVIERTNLQKALCGMFNIRKGYIFIGISGDEAPFIEGMILSKQMKINIEKQIKKIIKQYIGPDEEIKQILNNIQDNIKIKYIPVLKNLYEINNQNGEIKLNQMQEQQIIQKIFQGHYVIRIRIQLDKKYDKYLFYVKTQNLGTNNPQYQFFEYKKQKIIQKICTYNIYNKMIKKYKIKIGNYPQIQKHSKLIRCLKPLEIKQKITNKLFENNQQKYIKGYTQNNKFGKVPNKSYNHQSIIIVTKKGIQQLYFQKFKQNLKNKKIQFQCYQVYEQLKKDSKSTRSAYYITHQKKFDIIQKYLTQFQANSTKPNLFLFDVRKQLVLLDPKDKQTALNRLLYTFKLQFEANISYGQHQFYNPKVSGYVKQFYLSFFHHTYAIFAFIALQYINVRCNFVNNSKLDGVTMFDI